MARLYIMVLVFVLWSVVDLFCFKMLLDRFMILGRAKRKNFKSAWLIAYFIVPLAYACAKYSPEKNMVVVIVANILFFLFYLKAVPIIWTTYGIDAKAVAVVFLFEEAEAVISSTITLAAVFLFKAPESQYRIIDDCLAAGTAAVFLLAMHLYFIVKKRYIPYTGLESLSIGMYLLMAVLLFVTGNLEFAVWFRGDGARSRAYSLLTLILVIVICAAVIYMSRRNFSLEKFVQILDSQMTEMARHYRQLSEKDKQIRKLQHDMRNHLQAIEAFIRDRRYERASEYIEDLEVRYHRAARRFDTGSFLADALITAKADEAERSGTLIRFSGSMPDSGISDADLVILLSNMLDNAIEACCCLAGEKTISVESRLAQGMWVITVKNPVRKAVEIFDNQIATTKPDKEVHGLGIPNMENVISKYHGSIRFENSGGEFMARAGLEIR